MEHKRDWPKILQDLKDRGYTTYKVSLALRSRWEKVKSWEMGSEPKHCDGEALIAFYEEVITEKR